MTTADLARDHETPKGTEAALVVRDLRVDLERSGSYIVKDIDFEVAAGEILGVIGESGCGKTTVLTSLLGLVRPGAVIRGGSVCVDGTDLLTLGPKGLRHHRGGVVSYVPQDPSAALNPGLRIGVQLRETLSAHGITERSRQDERIRRLCEEVKLPSDRTFLRRYPHQLSGGQQQRVTIAMAFLCEPAVAVLDEPTTGLDVTTQAHVLTAVRELCRRHGTAGVFVSHDIAAVSEVADRIVVMYSGRIVEEGPTHEVNVRPAHPYTRALARAIPDPASRRQLQAIPSRVAPIDARPEGCVFSNRCDFVRPECHEGDIPVLQISMDHEARCLRTATVVTEPVLAPTALGGTAIAASDAHVDVTGLVASYDGHEVLHGVDLAVPRGIVMGLVGESGSGKSTLARCLGGLHTEATGRIRVGESVLPLGSRHRTREERLMVQYVFQSASSALNPRQTVAEAIAEPMRTLGLVGSRRERRARVLELLSDVALSPETAERYPAQLSGGERQRVTVARALATTPSVLICDEITSSLDVSVQASILKLIERLRRESDLTLLFVTHNLGVVRAIADEVAVLDGGVIVEHGAVDRVLDHPEHPYTAQLLRDTPSLQRPMDAPDRVGTSS